MISLYWFLVAIFLAFTEIELEGKYGWAEKSATWSKPFDMLKWTRVFTGTRTLTGYHIFLNIFLIIFMHAPFVFFLQFSWVEELRLISTYLIWALFWDFLWFILNPYYGWENFLPKSVWWFGKEPWVMNKLPLKYFTQIGIALGFIVLAIYLGAEREMLIDQLLIILYFILFTLLSHLLLRPIYHKYYWKMHKRVG